jgi:hypothetical protein
MPLDQPQRCLGGGGGGVTDPDPDRVKDQIDPPTTTTRVRVQLRTKLPEDIVDRLEELGIYDAERELFGFDVEDIICVLWHVEVQVHVGKSTNPPGLLKSWLWRMKKGETAGPLPWRQDENAYIAYLGKVGLSDIYTFPEYLRKGVQR